MNTINRNDPCPCGSGKKYKKCCYERDQEKRQSKRGGLFAAHGSGAGKSHAVGKKLLKKVTVMPSGAKAQGDSKGLSGLFAKTPHPTPLSSENKESTPES